MTKTCKGCGVEFNVREGTREMRREYHSPECASESRYADKPLKVRPGIMGAISEMIAAADLLRLGYEVFRAVSPHCSSDLIALKDGKSLRIEVRTARRTKRGKVDFTHRHFCADHFAVVMGNEVIYEPPL